MAVVEPSVGRVGPAVEEIKDWIRPGGGVIARRGIDVVVALVAGQAEDNGAGVGMVMDDAWGTSAASQSCGPSPGTVTMLAGRMRELEMPGLRGRERDTVDLEVVPVDAGWQGCGGGGPDTFCILVH